MKESVGSQNWDGMKGSGEKVDGCTTWRGVG